MALSIIPGTQAIPVEHPIFCIFGRPGIGKSSLGYSAPNPLLLDFDGGAHRAINRRDTLKIATWDDVAALIDAPDETAGYQTFTVDTVGRALDVITTDIARIEPKKAPGGVLSLQGFGTLKIRFRQWMSTLRAQGKDVLLIAHDREEKDGDSTIVRPDIIGASLGEVMRVSDFVGYLYMSGKDRVLDFNPTDKWVGKNPAGWKPFKLPPPEKAQHFMADLLAEGRKALGQISAESAGITAVVEQWREGLANIADAAGLSAVIPEAQAVQPPMAQAQVKALVLARAKALGFTFDKTKGEFVAPTAEPVGATA